MNKTADPVTLSGAILGDIPLVHSVEKDPTSIIETGDIVAVDGDKGTVRIIKKNRQIPGNTGKGQDS